MSGPQFANIQTFSNKTNKAGQSIDQIIAEATRDPEFSQHVDAPAPPRIIAGDPSTFRGDHDAHVAARSTSVKMKDGSTKQRAVRSDRHTMLSVVMSYPKPRASIITDDDKAKLARWEARNVQWLRDTYGDQVKVIMAHDDEEHPHLHAWILPDDPGADATNLHPGKLAKKRAEADAKAEGHEPKVAVKIGNNAYRKAMRGWQEAYHEAVGAPEGLTRTGPNRRRMTRKQWKAEKQAAADMAKALGRAEEAEVRAVELIEQARAEADQIIKEAEASASSLNKKAADVVTAVVALADEVKAGTIGKKDGRIFAAHPDKIRPGLPEVRPALHAVADAAQGIADERKVLKDGRDDLAADQAELAQEKAKVEEQKGAVAQLLDQLRSGLSSLLDFIKRPDLSVTEQMDAARLAKDVTPLVGRAEGLIGSGLSTKESRPKAGGLGGSSGGGLDGPGF